MKGGDLKDIMKTIFAMITLIFLFVLQFASALELDIQSPTEGYYDSKSVLFSLSVDERSYFYYSNVDNSGRWIKLCPEKDYSCERKVKVNEGENNFEVKAVSDEDSATEGVIFTVDSKKPIITKTFPSRSSIINGYLFSIWYSEENLKEITLYYGDDFTIGECEEAGMNKQCNFTDVDLTGYDGQEIYYWFEVSDKVNTVSSKKTKIKVDTTAPEILSEQYIPGGKASQNQKYMKFILDIKEENFDKLIYQDTNGCLVNPIFSRILCSNLQVGRCLKTKSFCLGNHDLTITAIDKAGNSESIEYSFDF